MSGPERPRRSLLDRVTGAPRRTWRDGGRVHVQVRALHHPDRHDLARDLAEALDELDAVGGVVLDRWRGEAVVEVADAADDPLAAVLEVIEDVESRHGTDQADFADAPHHPGDPRPLANDVTALALNAAALGVAVTGQLARWPRLPVEASAVASVVQAQPRLRRPMEAVLGTSATQVSLSGLHALGSALGQGPLGLLSEIGLRGTAVAEHLGRRRLWAEVRAQAGQEADPVAIRPRPTSLALGPVERHADRATAAGLAAAVATGAATFDLRRAAAAFLTTTPKAAVQGRDAFAAHVGRLLARRGILTLDRTALRHLDRLDALVVDGRVVAGAPTMGEVRALGGAGDEDVAAVVRALFHPDRTRRRGPWTLRPLPPRSPLRHRLDVRRAARDLGGERHLVLLHDGEPAAVVRLDQEVDTGLRAAVEAAQDASWMVAVSGGDGLVEALGADLRLDDQLVDDVRMLQEDGCGVALLSADTEALAAADLGIARRDEGVTWAADLTCPRLADAVLPITAAAVAHEVSRQSAAIALAGSSVGALLGPAVPAPGAGRRAMTAVNVAGLLAQANAARAAIALAGVRARAERSAPPWHELSADEVLDRLGTSADGRTEAGRPTARATGSDGLSLPTAVYQELANPLTPVLAGGAALSSAVGGAGDAVMIGAVTVVNALLGGTQRWRVDRAAQALEDMSAQQVRVRRPGAVEVVPAESLAVGDVILLAAGDSVPADCRLLEADGLEVDESRLTGESLPVAKSPDAVQSSTVAERSSMLYDGTTVAVGEAVAVVVAVDADTEAGAAAAAASEDDARPGGVEARLSELTRRALPLSAVGGGAVVAAGLLQGTPLRQTLRSGVSLAVAAVPEGLPLLATVAQTNAARRLASEGALVRNPRALEALGRADVLCADKTGTLTEGRIELRGVSDGAAEAELDALGGHHRYVLAVALRASPEDRGDDPLPHLTDQAVVDGAARAGVAASDGMHRWERRAELAFEPRRGYHAVLGDNGDGFLLSVKGAPEVVLPRCAVWDDDTGGRALDAEARARLGDHLDGLARQGLRVLAVAERRASGRRDLDDQRVSELRLLGFAAFADPVRASSADAVRRLADAGVRTVMITGDHPSTAQGIAAELGILDHGKVLTGGQIDALDDDELAERLDEVSVFARVTPSHKLRLVTAYQAGGHSVAMTGDGANDAPAIARADVGIAIGEHSSSGARRAADMVVPDGRIEVILDAIVEGRAMWSSVREAVALLLGGNLGEVAFTALGTAATGRPPLNARQLLLVNMLTDALPAMAMASRRPRDMSPERVLSEGPDASLGRSLDDAILARAVTTTGGAASAWLGGRLTGRRRRADTMALAAVVGTQLGQTLLGGGRDPLVAAAAIGSLAVLVTAVQTPGLAQAFGCTPLGPVGWTVATTSSAGAVAVSPLVERAVRLRHGT